jgi:DUF438 domain-containing protein
MDFTNRVNRVLHDEHCATVALMERLESLLARHRGGDPPDAGGGEVAKLLSDLAICLTGEVQRHFAFEEDQLFPYLRAAGDEAIGAHLTSEHDAIRPLGNRMATLAREATAEGFSPARWDEFRRVGRELCDRLLTHVQKEEMALLPLLEESMDGDTEMRLYQDYVETA